MNICVSGSSGVGKTTIAHLIRCVLGDGDTVLVSGDDLHRWERSDPVWNNLTHLNPEANDLEMGYNHIRSLKQQRPVSRRIYNHDTGKFDPAITIEPKKYIVYEGLHALYHDPTMSLADIKIFVDTDHALKIEWKVKRDTKKRGYTESQVLDTMRRRKRDEEIYIAPQKNRADIIVKFTKSKDGGISLDYVSVTGNGESLMSKVKDFYESLTEFMDICKWLSLEPSLTQGRGGNVSVKSNSGLIIKASGSNMADINLHHGFCLCNIDGESIPRFETEDEYNQFINQSKIAGTQRPSMETGFHASISDPDQVVVHTHPIHLNVILCSKEARAIVRGLFQDLSYEFVEYTTPGARLTNRIRDLRGVIFLENHGLIVSAKTAESAMVMTEDINRRCKKWLGNHVESFVDIEDGIAHAPLFPDAAVLPDEMGETNNYILRLMIGACLNPKFLDSSEVQHLNNMQSEKYRKALV